MSSAVACLALDIAGNGRPPLTAFTVSKSAHPAPLPKPGATIASREFGFIGASKIHDGEIACFMDTQDGREHTTLGMEKVIQIVK